MNLSCYRLFNVIFTLAVLLVTVRAAELPIDIHVRSGLPHVAAKLREDGSEVRVAFLGGSITAAPGWRVLILNRLKATYPNSKFTEIFAAISGTGSNLGAARVEGDVLAHRPDLMFVEFAVNDTGRPIDSIRDSMEGLVRKVRQLSPNTDLCFVYSLSSEGLPYVEAGKYPPPAVAMEDVADHYGIPSLHFGVEVVRRLRAGTLVFTGPSPSPQVPVFTTDKIHPEIAGHRIYTESLEQALMAFLNEQALLTFLNAAKPAGVQSVAPLRADNWEHAAIFSPEVIAADPTMWAPVADSDIRLSALPPSLRRPTFTARRPGVVLEFDFTGTVLGLYGIKGPDAGRFRVTVDGFAAVDSTLFDSYCTASRYRPKPWFYPSELKAGRHHVRIELLAGGPDKSEARAKSTENDPAFDINALTLSGVILDGRPSR